MRMQRAVSLVSHGELGSWLSLADPHSTRVGEQRLAWRSRSHQMPGGLNED
jgi:hypothetical protein